MVKCVQFSVITAICTGVLCQGQSQKPVGQATSATKAGDEALRKGDSLQAYLYYSQTKRSKDSSRDARRQVLQASPNLQRQAVPGVDPYLETLEAKMIQDGDAEELPPALLPVTLEASPGVQSYEIRGDGRRAIETMAAALGLQVVFDSAYQPVPAVNFRLANANFATALRAMQVATDSFFVAVRPKIILVARDTQQNRTQFEPVVSIGVPIPERLSVQEAQELLTGVQQVMELRRISTDPIRRLVIFRDQAVKVRAAQAMFLALSQPRTQVVVDVELIATSKTGSLNYGLGLPTSSNIVSFRPDVSNFVPPSGAADNLYGLKLGGTYLGVGIADAGLFATLARASAETLLTSQIASLDGQAATLHVGDRYPVTTSNYSSGTSDGALGQNVPPNIRFEDLGFILKITPNVHENSAVTLDIDAEFKTLGAGSVNGIPVISNRQFQGKVRLENGQWGIVAGLLNLNEAPTTSGILGLSQIPGLGRFFRHNTQQLDMNQMLIVLKPRVVTLPPWEQRPTPAMWVGSETRPAGF